jgi:YjbE family integral membrane protein
MDILSLPFLSALLGIVIIDLVLAGDNAIVIALAARRVPAHLQRRAIVWGTAGAILMRSAMTLVVVWLLAVPGLMALGGALLVWIAYRLLLPDEGGGASAKVHAVNGFWGAMRTIVVADTVMGLDNVLAVAGAAHGSFLLVVLGLLISVPIVVWGSTLMLRFVERYPVFVYLGAGVLAWTAVRMITHEPLLKDAFAANELTLALMYLLTVSGVLWAGFVMNHRQRESRIRARLQATEGEHIMLNILVPIRDAYNSVHAVRHVIAEYRRNPALQVHLLNVQSPFSRHITRFVSRKMLATYHQDEAEKVLRPMQDLLERAGVPFSTHTQVGHGAEAIVHTAEQMHCDHIVMSTARKNSLTRMVESSVTNRVLELTQVPVELIAGDAVSKVERYGVPAGVAAALGLLLLAVD